MIYKKRDGILQIKIFFVGLLIGSSYLIGDTIYKSFIKRHKELNEVIDMTFTDKKIDKNDVTIFDDYKNTYKIIYKCEKCHQEHKNIMADDDDFNEIINISKQKN